MESPVLRWSQSRFSRYDGVRVEICFVTPNLIIIILYVNCLKMKVNNLHQIAYILSYGVSAIKFKSSTKQALRSNQCVESDMMESESKIFFQLPNPGFSTSSAVDC